MACAGFFFGWISHISGVRARGKFDDYSSLAVKPRKFPASIQRPASRLCRLYVL